MKYIPMTMTAQDAQLIEQLKMTSETIASAFHVPAYMVGVGPAPLNNNVEALNQQYYGQCLQKLMEDIEEVLDQGLGLGPQFGNAYGTEFDITDLLRMDTKTKTEAARQAIQSGMSPNEIRNRYFDLGPTPGGETPYLQEQQWPIRHLAERPLPTRQPTAPAPMENEDDGADADDPDGDGGATAAPRPAPCSRKNGSGGRRRIMFDQIPEAFHDAMGIVIADQRKYFEREMDRRFEVFSERAAAVIAGIEAKVARLEVANCDVSDRTEKADRG